MCAESVPYFEVPPKSKRELLIEEQCIHASAGNRTRGWPTLSEGDLLMATANFTTKPPMLDEIKKTVDVM